MAANTGGEFQFHRLVQSRAAGGLSIDLLRHFVQELKVIKPDMIHVRGLGNEGFHGVFAARLAGVPKVLVSVHGTVRDLLFPKNRARNAFVRNVLEPATLRMATHVMTVCDYAAKRKFLSPYSNKFVGVVRNGVDLPVFDSDLRNQVRSEFGVGDRDVVSISVSRITKEKGYFALADALIRLPRLSKMLHVWVVGDGPDRAEIEAAMPRRDDVCVRFLGHRNDVGRFLQGGDMFVFPSLHENLSNALLEGMSFGLPPVAFSVGGNTEVLGNDLSGLIVPGDVDSFSRAIFRYIEDDVFRREDAASAKERVGRCFSMNLMVNRMFDVYRNVLN
ncbi:glycosyltransferase family 4 protein [Zoogloea sp.]|uniref:glycosyltransferase family 4 protein n=1 Tax=Zoogloea sp. TaxID=49181 RepID=UPI0035AF366D